MKKIYRDLSEKILNAVTNRVPKRLEAIDRYVFPSYLLKKMQFHYPDLTESEYTVVQLALKQYFKAFVVSGCQPLAMTSKVADDLWHELILNTREYERFCRNNIGKFLHHTTNEASTDPNHAYLYNAWYYACLLENINPEQPTKLPMIFAVDAAMDINGGFHYSLYDKEKLHPVHLVYR